MNLCRCGCGQTVSGRRVFVNQEHRLSSLYGSAPVLACKCGCGQLTRGKRIFVNREHMIRWMENGGARQMNALQPTEGKALGGHVTGTQAVVSGRLKEISKKGAAR